MIAGIKLVYAISNCPTISDEDKIKALDDIIDMVKTDYAQSQLTDTSIDFSRETIEGICAGSFSWMDSKLGFEFWCDKIYCKLK